LYVPLSFTRSSSTTRERAKDRNRDTNALDHIYDNKLTDKVLTAVDDGKIKLFATDAKNQEIEKIGDNARRLAIKQMAERIQDTFLATSAAVGWSEQTGEERF
jgi:hypothetical protein